jgi:hypothetical protein
MTREVFIAIDAPLSKPDNFLSIIALLFMK